MGKGQNKGGHAHLRACVHRRYLPIRPIAIERAGIPHWNDSFEGSVMDETDCMGVVQVYVAIPEVATSQ